MRALLIALIAVAPLAAQQPASDVIPRELALALIDRYRAMGQPAEIIVGRMPPSFPSNALPAGAAVLGGITRDAGAEVVIVLQHSPDSAIAELERHLGRTGWERSEFDQPQGFVPPQALRQGRFCRDDMSLSVSARERPGGGTIANIGSHRFREGRCDEDPRRPPRRFSGRIEIPRLHAPRGARMLGAGMSGGGPGGNEAFTRLEVEMHPIDIAAHYAKQLAEAGWTVTGPAVSEGLVAYGTRGRDTEGRPFAGALLILDIPGTKQHEVVLRAVTEERTR